MAKTTVIVPAYNEEETIAEAVQRVLDLPIETEIIVVDDASTDRTPEILAGIDAENLVVIRHTKNRGKGAAIRTALKAATGIAVVIQDADLEYEALDIPKLVEPILRGERQVVYGSRFMTGRPQGMAFPNWLANRILAWTATILFGRKLTDEATCYKAFETELLKSLNLTCTRFEFCPEATAKVMRRGIRILELPIGYKGRGKSEGKKIGLRDAFEAFWTLLKFRVVK